MALILEVLHPDGARTRHALTEQPLTVGRGIANDIVLDDPYVDPHHARVFLEENGTGLVAIEDLGSVNGVVAQASRQRGRVTVPPGAEFRLGQTTIRVRDPHETLEPALVDLAPGTPAATDAVRRTTLERWAGTTAGRAGIVAVAAVVFAVYAWSGNSARSSASDVTSTVLGLAFLMSLWAGLWSVASRIVVHRFHFLAHLAVASASAVGAMVLGSANNWLEFFFPDATVIGVVSTIVGLLLLIVFLAGHLALASSMPRRRQWRAASIVVSALFAVGLIVALAKDDDFSDVPDFSNMLKPAPAALIPTAHVDAMDAVATKLKHDVDALAAKK